MRPYAESWMQLALPTSSRPHSPSTLCAIRSPPMLCTPHSPSILCALTPQSWAESFLFSHLTGGRGAGLCPEVPPLPENSYSLFITRVKYLISLQLCLPLPPGQSPGSPFLGPPALTSGSFWKAESVAEASKSPGVSNPGSGPRGTCTGRMRGGNGILTRTCAGSHWSPASRPLGAAAQIWT